MSSCRSCQAEVTWAHTSKKGVEQKGLAPFEADEAGQWVIVNDVALPAGMLDEGQRYTNHFATCPQSDQWRKR